jgi:alanine racemase
MDQFVVDLDGNTASVGDPVVLFGDPRLGDPTLAQWADATGLAAEVVVSGLGNRIERIYS